MTRKRWRKLLQAQITRAGGIGGQTMNELKASKIIVGAYGAYWSDTGTWAPRSYEEQHELDLMFAPGGFVDL